MRVENESLYPYCCIGLISGKVNQDVLSGTGCLISPRIVLTCAHNLYDRSKEMETENLTFAPGLNGKSVRSYKVKNSWFHPEYKSVAKKKMKDFDIGFLEINADLSDEHGYLGIDCSSENLNNE